MELIPEDIELTKRLQNGDVEAFDLIYDKYAGKLYSFSLKYLRSAAEAEEIVQTVFLKLWENHKKIDKELSFKSYLFTIAYNDICKLFRQRKYQNQFIDEVLSRGGEISDETEESINYRSMLERVRELTDMLPERQRVIFRKSRQEGKSSQEIAKELNLSPGTIDNYISEAIKFIRNQLKNEELALLLFVSLFLL